MIPICTAHIRKITNVKSLLLSCLGMDFDEQMQLQLLTLSQIFVVGYCISTILCMFKSTGTV